jgi:hypothetical protein
MVSSIASGWLITALYLCFIPSAPGVPEAAIFPFLPQTEFSTLVYPIVIII